MFAFLTRLSVDLALWLAFAAAFAIGMQGFLKHRVLRMFDVGGAAIFGFLALFSDVLEPGLQVSAVRLVIDIALLAIALASLVARQPFTLQYARGEIASGVLARPSFVRANYLMTSIWAAAFALMGFADGAATFNPKVPVTVAVGTGLISLAGALLFTWRYPARVAAGIASPR